LDGKGRDSGRVQPFLRQGLRAAPPGQNGQRRRQVPTEDVGMQKTQRRGYGRSREAPARTAGRTARSAPTRRRGAAARRRFGPRRARAGKMPALPKRRQAVALHIGAIQSRARRTGAPPAVAGCATAPSCLTLASEADSAARFLRWFHQLPDGLENCGDLLVVAFDSFLQFVQLVS